jgi:hypothetical protein
VASIHELVKERFNLAYVVMIQDKEEAAIEEGSTNNKE